MTEIIDILQERKELPQFLGRGGLIGVELGVASGWHSRRLLETGLFQALYGVDIYGDHHDTREYIRAMQNVGMGKPYWLLRMSFDDALDAFPDAYFDYVYIDGYAHTGEEGGKTIYDWYAKVKVGGMIAGHDYHPKWPLVQAAVDAFALALGQPVMRTALSRTPDPQDAFPSWALHKISPELPVYPESLRPPA
ncbi:class I SAM-dependent methyltransferase [Leisingera thetidis]|uniref:class I SAM-dependent methyltransferase n=1 Tax=Leisingera thetidis TaxID=2930199 RepID=UPI0021F6EA93|nr:class I SAM-dependent methyltransferase [Leisingera thetidis]